MVDVTAEFSLSADRVWLNAAHQGPLPNRAAAAAEAMIRAKQQPHHLATPELFTSVPTQLRAALGRALDAPSEEIALANSSSYGIHLVANGLELGPGDEVIVAANDFPSTILPWLRLRDSGVDVHRLAPAGRVLTAAEVSAAITSRTRVVCVTWVHSFSGHVVDLDAIGDECRRRGVLFVVNGAQGVGGIPLRVHDHPIDALTGVGFKWLCGPYGTGYCWLHPDTLDRVAVSKLYWLGALTADDLARPELDLDLVGPPVGATRHDIFGTANFFNFAPMVESISLVLEIGVDRIHAHNLALAQQLEAGIDRTAFAVQDRGHPTRRSSFVLVRSLDAPLEDVAERLVHRGIDVAHRRGQLRFSPHFYNTADDIERALDALAV